MMIDAVGLLGLSIDQFYDITPYEFSIMIKGYYKQLKLKSINDVTLAYNTAAFYRVDKLEPLKDYLKDMKLLDEEIIKVKPNADLIEAAKSKGLQTY